MHTIKFTANDKQEHLFAITVRKNVNKYFKENGISTKGNIAMAIQTVAMLSFYIVPFILLLTLPINIWIATLFCVIMGIGIAGIGMCVMHDAAHGSYSHKAWVNKLLGSSIYLLGSNLLNWKIQHNVLHHAYTNIEGHDHDIDSGGIIRLCEHAPKLKFHKYQYIHAFFFYGLLTISKLILDFKQLAEFNKAGITKQHSFSPTFEYVKMIIVKILYLLVFIGLPIAYTPFSWWQVLLGFLIMQWTAGFILSVIFQLAHVVEGVDQPLPNADGVIENDWAVHELLTTANFARENHLLNWYVGGLNFQIEHHLFPNICHIHYKKIAPIVEKTAKEFGLKYTLHETFLGAIASHVRKLKELGDPNLDPVIAV